MSMISISGNRVAYSLIRNFGINAAIIVAAFLAVFTIGRAIGYVDFVAYEWKAKTGAGFFNIAVEPISIATPVWLNPGESLVGQYEAEIEAGQIRFFVRKGLIPTPYWRRAGEDHYVKESGPNQYVFTAEKADFYWPRTMLHSGNRSEECLQRIKGKSYAERLFVPDFQCPSVDLSFTVLWTIGR